MRPVEDELASAVRARRRRQQRRMTAAAGALTVVALVGGVVAAASLDGRAATVDADAPGGPVATTTTADPQPAEDPPPTSAPSGEDDEQPMAVPAETTTTTVPAPGACPADAVELRITTERSAYRPGERIVVHADGTNRSDHDCAPLESWEMQIRHDGSEYGYSTATMAARTEPAVWRAGETQRVTLEWNQESFDGEREQPAPAGAYTVTVTWGVRDGDSDRHVRYTGATTFEISEA